MRQDDGGMTDESQTTDLLQERKKQNMSNSGLGVSTTVIQHHRKNENRKKINNDVNKSSGLEMGLCSVEWMGLATALCSDVFTGER